MINPSNSYGKYHAEVSNGSKRFSSAKIAVYEGIWSFWLLFLLSFFFCFYDAARAMPGFVEFWFSLLFLKLSFEGSWLGWTPHLSKRLFYVWFCFCQNSWLIFVLTEEVVCCFIILFRFFCRTLETFTENRSAVWLRFFFFRLFRVIAAEIWYFLSAKKCNVSAWKRELCCFRMCSQPVVSLKTKY